MTSQNEHERAHWLLEERALGVIASTDADWLSAHLARCAECESAASEMRSAIALLRSEPVIAPSFLVSRTRTSVRIRARELQENAERLRLLGLSILLAALWTALSAYAAYAAYAAWGINLGFGFVGSAFVWVFGLIWIWIAPALFFTLLFIRGKGEWLRSLSSLAPERGFRYE